MRRTLILIAMTFLSLGLFAAPKRYQIISPEGTLSVSVSIGDKIEYDLFGNGVRLLNDSPVSLELSDGTVYGHTPGKAKVRTISADNTLEAKMYRKHIIRDRYTQTTFEFKDFSLVFRLYDEGMAYRFISKSKSPFVVQSEEAVFNFPSDWKAYVPYVRSFDKNNPEKQFFNSFENTYKYISLSEWEKGRLAFMPLLVEGPEGMKLCITESDLQNYPGMYLSNDAGQQALTAKFAPVPDEIQQGGHNMLQGLVKTRKPYIAECGAMEAMPWRIVMVSREDKELTDNDLVYLLGEPAREDMDFSWVKPGKVAWEWWNAWNLYDVDFKAGINNETYKYYIDFASEHGIQYVIFDEGWAVNKKADLMQVIPEIDLRMLVEYADSKNVGLILWAGYWAFDRDMEAVCKHYSEMGIKGFKVDFMDRDDQNMVAFHRRAAEIAAKYHLMLDFHGTYKPAGLNRTWPNVVNYEGVHGLEQMKWSGPETDQVTYDVIIPFVRMAAGPMDYTQGAMRNATKYNYRPVNSEPMSQGTRCRQLAEYVVFESPLNMLCDSPSNYMREPECTEFIANVPEVWDETRALDGKVGEYVAIARRKGNVWYIGAMTNWDYRELTLDLSFLSGKATTAEVYMDGPNSHRAARDFRKKIVEIPSDGKLNIQMAPGGGFAARIVMDQD